MCRSLSSALLKHHLFKRLPTHPQVNTPSSPSSHLPKEAYLFSICMSKEMMRISNKYPPSATYPPSAPALQASGFEI